MCEVDTPLFTMGQIVATPNALANLSSAEITVALGRHQSGDWGDLGDEDRQSNNQALVDGIRLLSAYHSGTQVKFWIITESDRSSTTVLLPEDY